MADLCSTSAVEHGRRITARDSDAVLVRRHLTGEHTRHREVRKTAPKIRSEQHGKCVISDITKDLLRRTRHAGLTQPNPPGSASLVESRAIDSGGSSRVRRCGGQSTEPHRRAKAAGAGSIRRTRDTLPVATSPLMPSPRVRPPFAVGRWQCRYAPRPASRIRVPLPAASTTAVGAETR